MKYHDIVKYVHLLIVVPVLFYVGCKGLDNKKVHKYVYVLLMVLAFEAFAVHCGVLNLKQYHEHFKIQDQLVKGSNYDSIFATGQIDRSAKVWFTPKVHKVVIKDHEFVPKFINVAKGDSIVWKNLDEKPHYVHSYTGLFKSNHLKQGETFKYTFNTQGVYNYLCDNHPYSKGSVGVVTAGNHPNVQDIDMDKQWNPYLHPINQSNAV